MSSENDLMKLQVIFESSPVDCESKKYIEDQPEWQRNQLAGFVDDLLKNNRLDHPDARKLEKDRWSLWIRRPGEDAVNHVCYLARADEAIVSNFAREIMDLTKNSKPLDKPGQKKLVLLNTDSHAVAIGRASEYIEPEYYASLMDSIQRELFLKTIEGIKSGQPSSDYTFNNDGTVSIHIDRPEIAYGVHLSFTAKWVG